MFRSRPFSRPLVLGASLLSLLVLASCSSPSPEAVLDTTPSESTTIQTTLPEEPVSSSVPPDEVGLRVVESLDAVKNRLKASGALRAEDLRFALLSEDGYKTVVEPRIGGGFIYAQGVVDVPASSGLAGYEDLGDVLGFSREFSSYPGDFRVKEDVWYLSSPDLAKKLSDRIVSDFYKAGVKNLGKADAPVVFFSQAGTRTPEDGSLPCYSVAIALSNRTVASVRFASACETSTVEWSKILASYIISEAQALGL